MPQRFSPPLTGAALFLLLLLVLPGAALEAAPEKELDILLVIDNSGSMKKSDPEFIIRRVLADFFASLADNTRLGMVVFDSQAQLVKSLEDVSGTDAEDEFESQLARIDYQGRRTNTPAAVERAIYDLKTNGRKEAQKIVVLLTDGIVDTGDKDADIESQRWLVEDLAGESRQAGIRIYGVAFTDEADFRLLQILAARTDAEYFRAYRAKDIQEVLARVQQAAKAAQAAQAAPAKPVEPAPPPRPAPPKAVVQTPAKQVQTPPPPSAAADTTANRMLAFLPAVMSVIAVLLGIFYLQRALRKGSDEKVQPDDPPTTPEFHPPGVPAQLIDAENVVAGENVSLMLGKSSISVGRDSGNDIVIPRDSVSSLHATIDFRNGYYYLEDHRSTNGTRLNDKRVRENEPVRLKSGDTIHFANYEFRFLLPDQAPLGETIMIEDV